MTPNVTPSEVVAAYAPDTPLVLKLLSWGVLAGMGGAVKFISASLKNRDALSPRRFMLLLTANVFISGFSGLIMALVFSTLSPDRTWQLVAAGVGGYAGTQILDVLALTMSRKMRDVPVPVSSVIPIPPSVDPGVTQQAGVVDSPGHG
jgi:hypothetical protein